MSGCFVAVVGPSGAGKDSVIDYARAHFAADDRVVFTQRVITRPAGEGEDSRSVTSQEFAQLAAAGAFALSWDAHGLQYGVPTAVAEAIHEGRIAVVNVSRATLEQLVPRFGRAAVVRITVPDAVREARIRARGREASTAVQSRLVRSDPAPQYPVDLEIVNDRRLEDAGEQLVQYLRALLLQN